MEDIVVPTVLEHEKLNGARKYVDPKSKQPYLELQTTKDGIFIIAMNRIKAKNGFDDMMYLCVADALNYAAAAEDVKIVVLTGNGDMFSSGADLRGEMEGFSLKLGKGMAYDPVGLFMLTLLRFTKPIVAAVNGNAIGVGCTLLPHCDICYAVDDAIVWTPFSRIAVTPEFCSSILFPRIMGPSVANEMLLMSRQVSTLRLKELGLFSDVFPRLGFLNRVLEEIRSGLMYPLLEKTFPLFKKMIRRHEQATLEKVCCYELKELDGRAERGEVAEAVIAFMQAEQAKKTKSKI